MAREGELPANEDVLLPPAEWDRHLIPRRGTVGLVAVPPDAGAVARAAELAASGSERAAGRLSGAFLAGADAPLLAAATLTALATVLDSADEGELWRVAGDAWLADQGLEFAARATVEAAGLIDTAGGVAVRPPGHDHQGRDRVLVRKLGRRVRAALAAAPEGEYAAIAEVLAGYRDRSPAHRAMTSFLHPTDAAWVDADVAEVAAGGGADLPYGLLLHAVGTAPQLDALVPGTPDTWWLDHTLLTTLADGLGAAVLPALLRWAESRDFEWWRPEVFDTIAHLPDDAAFGALLGRPATPAVDQAVLGAARRYPVRALRLLGARTDTAAVPHLRAHVVGNCALATALAADLPPAVGAILAALGTDRDAPESALPALLVAPPWTRDRKAARPLVVKDLSCDDAPAADWLAGEREQWMAEHAQWAGKERSDDAWAEYAAKIVAGADVRRMGEFFLGAPVELAAPLLPAWQPTHYWGVEQWGRVIVARFGADAYGWVLHTARRSAPDGSSLVLPLAGPELAILMADWLARLKSVRAVAREWLLRHPAAAARALVPPALGKAGTARRQAGDALRLLADAGHTEAVRAAADGYGAPARIAIDALLATDPIDLVPAKLPPLPDWTGAAAAVRIRLRDGSGVLPVSAAAHVTAMLSISRLAEPYAGLAVLRDVAEPADLSAYALALFESWRLAGYPAKQSWALDGLGLLGDDAVVRRLVPFIRAWPKESGHARAAVALDVLAAIGTDLALAQLNGIAEKVPFRALRTKASGKIAEVADALGLTPEQLADRLVPDFGLDPDGSTTLDYGRRRFVVGFDEQLKPYVVDEAGKRLKALPKPGAQDDAESAPAAYARFAALKKDVRAVAADQIRRLERAMVTRRRWTGDEFTRLFAGHPLLVHVARRLVWARYDQPATFRIAEDRTLADAVDDAVALPADAVVGIPHPAEEHLARWAEVFADYEILQPFAQLGREVLTLTDDERRTGRLTRFEGVKVPVGAVIGLERRGWEREAPMDGGVQGLISIALAPAHSVGVELDPGIAIGALDIFPEQVLREVRLHGGGEPDPVAASEMLRDLTVVTS